MNNRTDEFLRVFNDIHKWIQDELNNEQIDFAGGIRELRSINPVIRNHKDSLDVIRELRNVLVHKSNQKFEVAEPSAEILGIAKSIYDKLDNPMRISKFIQMKADSKVVTFESTDTIGKVLRAVDQYRYSQFPVFGDDGFQGLLTESGITSWLAKHTQENSGIIFDAIDVSVADIMKLDEKVDSHSKIYKEETIYKLIETFDKSAKRGENSTILICEKKNLQVSGPEDITGIITAWDLPKLYEQI